MSPQKRKPHHQLPLFLLLTILTIPPTKSQTCTSLNACSGHGTCNPSTDTCTCYSGWGAPTDVGVYYSSPDCSLRTCLTDRAWGDVPTSATAAHALAECSNRGTCDRTDGVCECFKGFEGSACQRKACPGSDDAVVGDCSGHGVCLSMVQMAARSDALPLSVVTTYTGFESTTTWDSDKIYGCVCDSSWTVGLGSGERQEPEYFGPDCSLRHCPSGDDPRTTSVDETDCAGVTATGGRGVGAAGNVCHVDCSNRGICDYGTGKCQCFDGYYGEACNLQSALAQY